MKLTPDHPDLAITLNTDGTVTIWDCIRQSWTTTRAPSDALLATLNDRERDAIASHLAACDWELERPVWEHC